MIIIYTKSNTIKKKSILAKRLTEKQKEEIIKLFTSGISIENLSKKFNCTPLTISRNLKKKIDEEKYQELILKSKKPIKSFDNKKQMSNPQSIIQQKNKNQTTYRNDDMFLDNEFGKENLSLDSFIEIAPLDYVIDNSNRKELSSVPISDVDLPNIVYMIVDKKIELEIKLLKDYPEWDFLPTDDLNRKTIEIYLDLKIAKRFCNKEQKVIKVPNSNIFKIVAPILISKGISRIVSSDKLISL